MLCICAAQREAEVYMCGTQPPGSTSICHENFLFGYAFFNSYIAMPSLPDNGDVAMRCAHKRLHKRLDKRAGYSDHLETRAYN